MENDLNEKKTLEKPYRKITLACLVIQFCTELGPAQPQLVSLFYWSLVHSGTWDFLDKKIGTLP